MKRTRIVFTPIGVIRSEHTVAEETPIQPVFAKSCKGRVEIFPQYAEGLRDVEGFSHIYLIYVFHKAGLPKLIVKPFLQDVEHGIFAVRGPCRPNPIGLSVVRLIRREGAVLYLDGLDVLDGTPLLDIKPYTARFDRIATTRNGWQDEVDEETAQRRGPRGYREAKEKEAAMPKGNGTGPIGQGPGTGRRRGPCGGGQRKGPSAGAGKGQGRGRGGRGQGTGRSGQGRGR